MDFAWKCLSREPVGSKIWAKIIIYTFTRARLLCRVCYETPCIQKVQGSAIVFTTIEKDKKKIFHQSSIHIYFSDNDMSLLYWLTYLYIVCILWQRLEHDTGIICCSKSINQLWVFVKTTTEWWKSWTRDSQCQNGW